MTPKAKTLQERFGFSDPELTTPSHDSMMLWLDENVRDFVVPIAETLVADKFAKRYEGRSWSETVPVIEKTWEYCLMDVKSSFRVGFIDMKVVVHWNWTEDRHNYGIGELPAIKFYFEVKPQIRSLGETIRQIRLYESSVGAWDPTKKFYIVSPDIRFRQQFESQGIGFLECPAL